ncbi:MAG TPA: arginase family protein [Rhodocyclaceae bacterium]|nr:arginase family protein [Rhodocyclaceae bacterium]
MKQPLVLDFDGSLRDLAEATVLPLGEWQETIRFGCGLPTWRALRKTLNEKMPNEYGPVLMGSGDFHHLSHLLIQRLPQSSSKPFDVVVCDNHPDNMRFPFGIHCGSWVRHAAMLPNVRTVHVVGISSGDVGWRHAWENYLSPLYAHHIHYWTVGVDTRWAGKVGLASSFSSFSDRAELMRNFIDMLRISNRPVYLSIDKDVLDPAVARTNWDQGSFALEDIEQIIDALDGRLIGSDITGEVSIYRYRARWKRWLSAIDDQPSIPPQELARWQQQQITVNRRLLARIAAVSG